MHLGGLRRFLLHDEGDRGSISAILPQMIGTSGPNRQRRMPTCSPGSPSARLPDGWRPGRMPPGSCSGPGRPLAPTTSGESTGSEPEADRTGMTAPIPGQAVSRAEPDAGGATDTDDAAAQKGRPAGGFRARTGRPRVTSPNRTGPIRMMHERLILRHQRRPRTTDSTPRWTPTRLRRPRFKGIWAPTPRPTVKRISDLSPVKTSPPRPRRPPDRHRSASHRAASCPRS